MCGQVVHAKSEQEALDNFNAYAKNFLGGAFKNVRILNITLM
jgi:hypothetical protein